MQTACKQEALLQLVCYEWTSLDWHGCETAETWQACGMQGKYLTAVAAAKRHTVVLTREGDVFTWGHKMVTPKRIQLAGAP